MTKIKLEKEYPNPKSIEKRLKQKGFTKKILSVYIAGNIIEVELEGKEKATAKEKKQLQEYFENNPYYVIVEKKR